MADNQEPYQLAALSDEEAKKVLDAFENFKTAHGVELSARPFIDDRTGTIGCEVRFFKRVVLAPKAEGFQQEGDNGTGTAEPIAA